MLIRPATPPDLPHVERLREERYTLIRQARPNVSPPAYALADCLGDAGAAFRVALVEGDARPAGYGIGWRGGALGAHTLPPDHAVIGEVALDMHRYHSGLGRRIVASLCEAFAEWGSIRVWALVPRWHAVEQAFWRSLGAWVAAPPGVVTRDPDYDWMALP